MKKTIHPKEREHFEYIYSKVAPNFPKECGCGRIYQDQLEYIQRTYELEGVGGCTSIGVLNFSRNCECGSTLGLNIDPHKGFKEEWGKFIEYISNRAQRNKRDFFDEVQQVRREYNEIFLPRRIEQNRNNESLEDKV